MPYDPVSSYSIKQTDEPVFSVVLVDGECVAQMEVTEREWIDYKSVPVTDSRNRDWPSAESALDHEISVRDARIVWDTPARRNQIARSLETSNSDHNLSAAAAYRQYAKSALRDQLRVVESRSKLVEWGKIVPGVNTTKDVGPDAIEKFANALSLGVDRNGRPKRLMTDKDQPALGKKRLGESANLKRLSDEIFDFLSRHSIESAIYDPDYDEECEKYNGPDSSMLHRAAEVLASGRTPEFRVHSSYGSGCYTPWPDKAAESEHDRLVKTVNSLAET